MELEATLDAFRSLIAWIGLGGLAVLGAMGMLVLGIACVRLGALADRRAYEMHRRRQNEDIYRDWAEPPAHLRGQIVRRYRHGEDRPAA